MNTKELEERFTVISNRFSEFLDVRKKIEDLQDDVEIERALRKKMQENIEVFKKQHRDEVIGVGKQITEGILDIDRAMDKFRLEIKELRETKDNLFACLNNVRQDLEVPKEDIKKLQTLLYGIRFDVDKNASHVDSLAKTHEEKAKKTLENLNALDLETKVSFKTISKDIDERVQVLKKDVSSLKDTLLKIGIDFTGDIGKHERAIRDLKASIDTNATIAPNLPQDSVTRSELDNVSSKLESIALDTKNASLKAGNSAIQIDLINKKLENLQLTIKSFELQSKGA